MCVLAGRFSWSCLAVGILVAHCEECLNNDTFAALQAVSARSEAPGPPAGLGEGGNPVTLMKDVSNVDIDDEVLACSDPKWKPGGGMWTFEQIAEAFMEFGYKKFYEPGSTADAVSACVASLTIAAGECQETHHSLGVGCDAQATYDSGVFQLDFLRAPFTPLGDKVQAQINKDGNMINLCISGFGAGFITAAPYTSSAKKGVAYLEKTSIYTCMGSPADVNAYSCPDPLAKPGVTYANFIGTFCHKGYLQNDAEGKKPCSLTQTTPRCCGVFMGGANGYQLAPFPEYYFMKAQEHLSKMRGKSFKTICEKVVEDLESTT
ncbi:unnamed protein product [Symbiodinium natans]|uniref:Uncharacterized protein n=1 Tax=Symbiodinium natans TaxID=878477 RepID=A0A812QP15_9DINO|nr:unnamed protein product [Symbiodinium natans]